MKGVFLVLFSLVSVCISQPTMIQSVGIIIYYEIGSEEKFKNYIKHFHEPTCTTISQFNIVVSQQATSYMKSLQHSFKLLEKFIPIHYIYAKPGENSNFKLKVGKNSKAQFYYTSSMNVAEQGCSNILNLVFLIQRKSFASLIGLVGQNDSLSSVVSDLTKIKNQFAYTKETPQHFTIVQNIRIISRHILQLSKSNIPEVQKMRNKTTSDCEEIFLNFVASHFYPQLKPSFQVFNSSLANKGTAQGMEQRKSKCLRTYIDILGYLPLFYHRKDFTKSLWVNPNLANAVQIKKNQLMSYLQKSQQTTRRLQELSYLNKVQKQEQSQTLSADQKQLILNALRIAIIVFLMLAVSLYIQLLILPEKEQRNRSQ